MAKKAPAETYDDDVLTPGEQAELATTPPKKRNQKRSSEGKPPYVCPRCKTRHAGSKRPGGVISTVCPACHPAGK